MKRLAEKIKKHIILLTAILMLLIYIGIIIIIYVNCLIDIAIWYTIYKEVKGDFYVRKISLGKIY